MLSVIKPKKIAISLALVLLVSCIFTITAFAAIYHSQTVTIGSSSYTTPSMGFEGNSVTLLSDSHSYGVTEPEISINPVYKVTLQKNVLGLWISQQYVWLPCNSTSSMVWNNTGSGNFRFIFERQRYDVGHIIVNMQAYG